MGGEPCGREHGHQRAARKQLLHIPAALPAWKFGRVPDLVARSDGHIRAPREAARPSSVLGA